MRTGRPKAVYADALIHELESHPGDWLTWVMGEAEADRMVRKLKREGYRARRMKLERNTALLAARSTP